MAKKTLNFTIDTLQNSYSPVGTVKQLDSVFFNIQVTEQGQIKILTGQIIKLFARKADGKIVEQKTGINITSATEGKITIDLLNAALQATGLTTFELEISDNTGIISTANFTLKVQEKISSDEAIESTNEFETLKEVELYVVQAKREIQDFKLLQNEMKTLNDSMRLEEEKRVQAEIDRDFRFNDADLIKNTKEINDAKGNSDTLKEELDNIVNNMNDNIKVQNLEFTGEGSITVENSMNGFTKDLEIQGNTLQNLSTIKALGTNKSIKLNLFTTNKTYTMIALCTNTDLTGGRLRLGFTKSTGDIVYFGSSLMSIGTSTVITKFNLNFEFTSVTMVSQTYGDIGEFTSDDIRILEGDWTNKPIPEYFDGIKSVGDAKKNTVSILSHGKNLFNINRMNENANNSPLNTIIDNKIIFTANNANVLGRSYKINNIKKDTQYTITVTNPSELRCNFNVSSRDGVNWYGQRRIVNPGETISWQVTSDIGYLSVSVNIMTHPDEVRDRKGFFENIQIEEGTIATEYEPYKLDEKDILLPFEDGLKGIGNITDKISDKIIQKIKKVIFNGTEDWTIFNIAMEEGYISFYNRTYNAKMGGNLLCDKFNVTKNSGELSNSEISYLGDPGVFITISKAKLETQNVAGFKKWLQANSITIYYELADPIKYDLNNQQASNLKTFYGTTHVTSKNSIKSTLKFKAPVDVPATIVEQRKKIEKQSDYIEALEEENIQLREDLINAANTLNENDTKIIKQNLDMDFRLMEIEFALDIPLVFNFSNNKTGGNVKMARTPYEMMKIVVLSGDYDKDDYLYKAKVYLERKRMIQAEYDELVALMTADEVLNK